MSLIRKCLAVVAVGCFLTALAPGVAGADSRPIRPLPLDREQHDITIGRNWRAAWPIVQRWQAIVTLQRAQARQQAEAQAALQRSREHATQRSQRHTSQSSEAQYGSGACGGSLPPCYIMRRESGGNIRAQNPNSTASGKWQFLDSTWHSVTGLPGSASDYDEATQDAAARKLWNGGAGAGNWACTPGSGCG